jgi:glycosyltransferase involved in cell wall biosynthesis
MRVLIIDNTIPFPPIGGGELRTYHLVRALAVRHEVTLVGFAREEAFVPPPFPVTVVECPYTLPPLYHEIRSGDSRVWRPAFRELAGDDGEPWFVSCWESPAMDAAVREAARGGVDLAVVEHTAMGRFLPCLPAGVPRVLDLHNVHARMARREADAAPPAERRGARREARRALEFERRVADACQLCLAVSGDEADAARDLLGVPRPRVVPNGVDTRHFTPSDAPVTAGSLLFTGKMNYPPNAEAARYFAREVLPLVRRHEPAATFHVVGAEPGRETTALSSGSVVVHGTVPDVLPYYRRASVVVVPLSHGGGTRLKVLEAAACGKAIVSTPLGAEGLGLRDGHDLVLAEGAAGLAREVARLLADGGERRRLGANARAAALPFDWDAVGDGFRSLLEELAPPRPGAAV